MDELVERRLRDIAGDGTCLGDDVAEAMGELDAARADNRGLLAANESLRRTASQRDAEIERLRGENARYRRIEQLRRAERGKLRR